MILFVYKVVTFLFLCMTGAVVAADGDIGGSTTSVTPIDVTIPKLIRIAGFTDFTFTWSNGGRIDANDNLVVSVNYGNTLNSRLYQITGFGDGVGSAFTLTNGTATMPYRAWFNDRPSTGGRQELTSGTPLINQNRVNSPLSDNTERANISIRIIRSVLRNAAGGTYTGVLTIVVAPE